MTAVLGIPGLEAVEHLGSDGFVTTYRAYDTQLAQKVNVEVLPPVSGNEVALQRFEQTLRALYAKPRHPAILPIHELGQLEDGRPYVITLRSTLRSLDDRVSEMPLSSREVAGVGAVLADALAVAHDRGVLHGDVRLDHLRFTLQNEPVLGAFGYSRLAPTLRTGRGDVVTSLTNASPEVLSGADPDAAADVWALSCCLHQLLVGRSPFGLTGKPSLPAILASVMNEPLEDLRAAGVDDDLATVLEAALQRDLSTRLATAASLRRALRGVGRIHGEPRARQEAAATQGLAEGEPAPDPSTAFAPSLPPHAASGSPRFGEVGRADVERAGTTRQILILLGLTGALVLMLAISIFSLVR